MKFWYHNLIKKKKEKISIFDENNYIVNGHPNEFHANRCCYNQFNRVITLKLENMWSDKKYYQERNETEDDFHAFEDFLSEERNFDIVFKLGIQLEIS